MKKNEIEILNSYYKEGLCTFSEWYNKFLEITTESNLDEHINSLEKLNLRDLFIEEFEKYNYPHSSEGWDSLRIGTTCIYNSTVTQEDTDKLMNKEKEQLSKIVPLLREKLKLS